MATVKTVEPNPGLRATLVEVSLVEVSLAAAIAVVAAMLVGAGFARVP